MKKPLDILKLHHYYHRTLTDKAKTMKLPKLPKQMEKLAHEMATREIEKDESSGSFSEGNPNNPIYNSGLNYTRCFGLSWSELFSKQQKG